MRDNDDLLNIPSMVPARDEVVHRQDARKQSDIERPVRYGETIKVSTWPVRIMLGLLTLSIGAGGALGYQVYTQNLAALEQANIRLEDLESRLALVGNSAEETTANVIERLDFNFSEVDKLWAARNLTNQAVNELTGKIAVLQDASTGHTETTDTLSELLARNAAQTQEAQVGVNRLSTVLEEANQAIAGLNTSMQGVQNVAQDMAKYAELRWLDRNHWIPGVVLAVVCYLIDGWSGLAWGFLLSTVILYHGTFTINSLTHLIGKRRFPTTDESRNHWLLAIITLGEGWHNNHHYYQTSANQGFYWWEYDISFAMLRVLSWFGIVWDLRRPPANVMDLGKRLDSQPVLDAPAST